MNRLPDVRKLSFYTKAAVLSLFLVSTRIASY